MAYLCYNSALLERLYMHNTSEERVPFNTLIRVRTDDQLRSRLKRIARRRGCDESDVVREALIGFATTEEDRLGMLEPQQLPDDDETAAFARTGGMA